MKTTDPRSPEDQAIACDEHGNLKPGFGHNVRFDLGRFRCDLRRGLNNGGRGSPPVSALRLRERAFVEVVRRSFAIHHVIEAHHAY